MPTEFLESVETSDTSYRARLFDLLSAGSRYAGTYVAASDALVRTLLVAPDSAVHLVSVPIEAGTVPSIVDLVAAADWDEREAADLYGIDFAGHTPMRPLVNHVELERWTVPVTGDGPYQVAVGPIHAGVIESGHFRFHVVGDRILQVDVRLFYKHRGLERAAQGHPLDQATRYVARACAACHVSNSIAYAHACEQALGLLPSPELARVRTILLELERIWNHLNDIAAVCAGVGLAAGNNHFAGLTERARRLNAAMSGHRFLFGTVRVGGSDLSATSAQVGHARAELASLRTAATRGWRELLFNASMQDRLRGAGTLTGEQARQLGTVGPAARSVGLAQDARISSTRLCYDAFKPVVSNTASGDVKARLDQRAYELWQSFDLLDHLLDGALTDSTAVPATGPQPIGIGCVEGPRGATHCVVERTGDLVARLRLRTASYANWPSVTQAASGAMLPDFPLINKSFELCYACADR